MAVLTENEEQKRCFGSFAVARIENITEYAVNTLSALTTPFPVHSLPKKVNLESDFSFDRKIMMD